MQLTHYQNAHSALLSYQIAKGVLLPQFVFFAIQDSQSTQYSLVLHVLFRSPVVQLVLLHQYVRVVFPVPFKLVFLPAV